MTPEQRRARNQIGLGSIVDQTRAMMDLPLTIREQPAAGMSGGGTSPKLSELLGYQDRLGSGMIGDAPSASFLDMLANNIPPDTLDAPAARTVAPGNFSGTDLTIDPTCVNVPEVYDPGVRTSLADALNKSQTPQLRYPDSPSYIEYGFSGGPRSAGYDMSPIYTDHIHNNFFHTLHGLPRTGDTFIAHTHPNFGVGQGFSDDDIRSHQSGVADILVGADGKLRCIPGR